jgi:DNA-binding IclR family transcriptional regulator
MLSRSTQILILFEAIDFNMAFKKIKKALRVKKQTITNLLSVITALEYLERQYPEKQSLLKPEMKKANNALKRVNHV